MQQNLAPGEALALVLAHTPPPSHSESVTLLEALGRVLAREVVAPLDLPPFDNSAMDGYAVRHADLRNATDQTPVALPCASTVAAAKLESTVEVGAGACVRIMTGAPLPPGADAVVAREDVDETDRGRIAFTAPAREGQHIRRRGEDIARGEVAIEAGTRLRPSEVALAAACGLAKLEVARSPRVAIIATGDELAEPGEEIAPGQIYNSNSFALEALCRECGATVTRREHVGDDPQVLAQRMKEAARLYDVVITSGGVSAGDFDPVRDLLLSRAGALQIHGAHVQPHFWKAAIKPGKPILFATLQWDEMRGGRKVLIFALPGNPVSVAVTFELFVRPALLAMQGMRREASERRAVRARVDRAGRSPADKAEFVRAFVEPDSSRSDGSTWIARITGAQGSGRLTTMARANALLVIPAAVERFEAGEEFEARLFD